jgi:hypothetical protein
MSGIALSLSFLHLHILWNNPFRASQECLILTIFEMTPDV